MRPALLSRVLVASALVALPPTQTPTTRPVNKLLAKGISRELARERAARVSNVAYDVTLDLYDAKSHIGGLVTISFDLESASGPLALDFAGDHCEVILVNGRALAEPPRRAANHVVLSAKHLKKGSNKLVASFRSPVSSTGTPLTRYTDSASGEQYYYTLLVPADAHRLFPCFDQPDLKATLTLKVTHGDDQVVVGNSLGETKLLLSGKRSVMQTRLAPSSKLSSYLFAFAAGPFDLVEAPTKGPLPRPLRIYLRGSKLAELDEERVVAMHLACLARLEDYFATPYPFSKLDIVLVPGFPYGGMEHAGAIFYRESALCFDHTPTEQELMRRSTLVYHELSHQWFGNLVTMRWFDDLWLKEGFATFAAYRTLDELEPERNAWLRFHQRVKPSAYRVDVTEGTVPVWQELGNIADAKSNYGAIVYNKAPAVLRELEQRVGPDVFRDGLRRFLAKHAFANASWKDLLATLEAAGAKGLAEWSRAWILGSGVPRVRVELSTRADGKIAGASLVQERGAGDFAGPWPLRVDLLVRRESRDETLSVVLDGERAELEDLVGRESPRWILPNPRDVSYGVFLLDATSRDRLLEDYASISDPLARAVAWSALWESVREAELDAVRFVRFATGALRDERDALSHARILAALTTALSRYIDEERAGPLRAVLAEMLTTQLREGRLRDLELQVFRALLGFGPDPVLAELCRELLDHNDAVEGLTLGTEDRFRAVGYLLAGGAKSDATRLAAEKARGKGDVEKYAFLAEAGRPDPAVKARYFASFLDVQGPPEQWVRGSLANFHAPRQEALTLPYLSRALDKVSWVKEHRKIFFMPAWIDAFVNAHSSREALTVVEGFLAKHDGLPIDIRRKVLQSVDGLRRAVRIRERR